jgi:Cu+-exporting ATPase
MNTTVDPVCGAELNVENAEERSEYAGRAYYFCSDACRNKFDENPARYADRAGAKAAGPEAS